MIRVLQAVACDDIRQEVNGKLILIGVYTGDVLIPQYPVQLGFAIWALLGVETNGEHKVTFSVRSTGNVEFGRFDASIFVKDFRQPISMNIPAIPVFFTADSELIVTVREQGSDKEIYVVKKNVIKRDINTNVLVMPQQMPSPVGEK